MRSPVNARSVSQLVVIYARGFELRSLRINGRFYFGVAQTPSGCFEISGVLGNVANHKIAYFFDGVPRR